jgi:hypothetical protein
VAESAARLAEVLRALQELVTKEGRQSAVEALAALRPRLQSAVDDRAAVAESAARLAEVLRDLAELVADLLLDLEELVEELVTEHWAPLHPEGRCTAEDDTVALQQRLQSAVEALAALHISRHEIDVYQWRVEAAVDDSDDRAARPHRARARECDLLDLLERWDSLAGTIAAWPAQTLLDARWAPLDALLKDLIATRRARLPLLAPREHRQQLRRGLEIVAELRAILDAELDAAEAHGLPREQAKRGVRLTGSARDVLTQALLALQQAKRGVRLTGSGSF